MVNWYLDTGRGAWLIPDTGRGRVEGMEVSLVLVSGRCDRAWLSGKQLAAPSMSTPSHAVVIPLTVTVERTRGTSSARTAAGFTTAALNVEQRTQIDCGDYL